MLCWEKKKNLCIYRYTQRINSLLVYDVIYKQVVFKPTYTCGPCDHRHTTICTCVHRNKNDHNNNLYVYYESSWLRPHWAPWDSATYKALQCCFWESIELFLCEHEPHCDASLFPCPSRPSALTALCCSPACACWVVSSSSSSCQRPKGRACWRSLRSLKPSPSVGNPSEGRRVWRPGSNTERIQVVTDNKHY